MIKKTAIILLVLFIITFCPEQNSEAKDAPSSTAQEEQSSKAKAASTGSAQKEQNPKTKNAPSSTTQKESPLTGLSNQVDVINTDITRLKNQVTAINADMSGLQKQIDGITARLDSLAATLSQLEQGNAFVNTEEGGYAIVRTKFGTFAIISEGYSQYLDGYKIKLKIGNLTSANFKDARLIVFWEGQNAGMEDAGQRGSAQKNLIFYIPKELASGKYTNVDVILTPAGPDDIKTIQVGLELNELSLKK